MISCFDLILVWKFAIKLIQFVRKGLEHCVELFEEEERESKEVKERLSLSPSWNKIKIDVFILFYYLFSMCHNLSGM